MRFGSWFVAFRWKLVTASVPTAQHVPIACQKLQGPVSKTCVAHSKAEKWDLGACSLDQLRKWLGSFFLDAEAFYSRKVIDMTFQGRLLAQNLQNIRLYVSYSSFESNKDHNTFLHGLVREKLNSSVPNCLNAYPSSLLLF